MDYFDFPKEKLQKSLTFLKLVEKHFWKKESAENLRWRYALQLARLNLIERGWTGNNQFELNFNWTGSIQSGQTEILGRV